MDLDHILRQGNERQDQPKHESAAGDFKASKCMFSKKILSSGLPAKEWHGHVCSSIGNADVLW